MDDDLTEPCAGTPIPVNSVSGTSGSSGDDGSRGSGTAAAVDGAREARTVEAAATAVVVATARRRRRRPCECHWHAAQLHHPRPRGLQGTSPVARAVAAQLRQTWQLS